MVKCLILYTCVGLAVTPKVHYIMHQQLYCIILRELFKCSSNCHVMEDGLGQNYDSARNVRMIIYYPGPLIT